MRREVAQALDDGEGEIGRRHLEGETFAYQPGKLGLIIEGIDTGDDAASAMTEKEHRQARFP